MERNLWYAVTTDEYDAWDRGSADYEKALAIANEEAERDDIAWVELLTIDDGPDPFCLDAEKIKGDRMEHQREPASVDYLSIF